MDPTLLLPHEARAIIRSGGWTSPTETIAQPFVHATPIVLPAANADSFAALCDRNPTALPVLERLSRGAWASRLASDSDVRNDVGRYRVYESGVLASELASLAHVWDDGFETFLIGTSHSLGTALKEAGIPDAAVDNPRPAIYRTSVRAAAAGELRPWRHVTVKFIPPALVPTVVDVSSRLPGAHGPVFYVGDPAEIGADAGPPAFGFPLQADPGTVPVFWECSYTGVAALRDAAVPWFACGAPARSFITDQPWRWLIRT